MKLKVACLKSHSCAYQQKNYLVSTPEVNTWTHDNLTLLNPLSVCPTVLCQLYSSFGDQSYFCPRQNSVKFSCFNFWVQIF